MENNVPKEWIVKKLGDFVESEKGKKPKREMPQKDEIFNIPYVDIEAFEKNIIKSYTDGAGCKFCTEKDFLMVWDGSRSGLVGKGVNGAIGSTLVKINFPNIENKLAFYFLQSKYLQINTRAKGTGTPHVDPDLLWNYSFPIISIFEQKKIVSRIEELFSDLDNGIESLKKAKDQIKIYRQSVLKNAFEGKLTEKWREENHDKLESPEVLIEKIKQAREEHYQKQVEEWEQKIKKWEENSKDGKKPNKPQKINAFSIDYDREEMPEIPKTWLYIKSEFIAFFVTKGTTPESGKLFSNKGEIPFVKVYNLTKSGKLDFTINPTFVEKETHAGFLARSIVYPDDILMNIVGPPLGKVSIVPKTFPEWNINQAIVRYRVFRPIFNKFLAYYLLSKKTLDIMIKKSKATVGQWNLTLEICRELPIPMCSLEEQNQIVLEIESKFSVCDKLEESIDYSLKKAEILRQSILKKAFSGELTKQWRKNNPDLITGENSAENLLEKIKAEKEALK